MTIATATKMHLKLKKSSTTTLTVQITTKEHTAIDYSA